MEPVNDTLSTPGWSTRWAPASRSPGTMLTTPGGRPSSSTISARSRASSGVSGAALTTTAQPASSAGASFDTMRNCGMFQGTMAATTPTGSRRSVTSCP